jgi:hypothetical protein
MGNKTEQIMPYHKTTSHGPEVKAKLSPPSPKKSWGVGSYYADGRACSAFSRPGGYAQCRTLAGARLAALVRLASRGDGDLGCTVGITWRGMAASSA